MIDSLFSAALAFCILVGGTLAIGSAMLEPGQPQAKMARQVQSQPASRLVAATRAPEASQPTLR